MFVATAGYVGYAPIAPGTFGSMVGVAIYAGLQWTGLPLIEAAAIVAIFALGLWSADVVEQHLGKDPGVVVIDEVLGMLVTMAFLDLTPFGAVVAFVAFRVFDVVKPWPAGRLEHLRGGPGVMMDDFVAGVYAHVVMRLLIEWAPGRLV